MRLESSLVVEIEGLRRKFDQLRERLATLLDLRLDKRLRRTSTTKRRVS